MRNFTFFVRPGSAGIIRGIQVAEYLGGKVNPKDGYDDDICIFVKCDPNSVLPRRDIFPKHSYLDVVDAIGRISFLTTHLEIGMIAQSKNAQRFLNAKTERKDCILIEEHHCNWDRYVNPIREVKNVGIIGSKTSFQYPHDKFRDELQKIGLNLLYEEDFWGTYHNRQDVAEFYKNVDIQVVWRPDDMRAIAQLRNPLKLENAGSFGIPTVCYPEKTYQEEWGGYFYPALTIPELLDTVNMLNDNRHEYKKMSERVKVKAEKYHIDHIAELYKRLLH